MSPHELQTSILNESLDSISRSTSNMLQHHNTVHLYTQTDRQTCGQTDRQTDGQTASVHQ